MPPLKRRGLAAHRGGGPHLFNRVDNGLCKSFGKLNSGTRPLSSTDRLRILHDFFRPGDEQYFHFDLAETIRKEHGFRDYICPDGLQFKSECWKRFCKYGGIVTGIIQNVEECLRSDTSRLMLANSEFLMLFNQAATDRRELAKMLNISTTQMSYITNADAGHGLVKVGGSIVPFINEFPRDTELYRLMTTTPGEN